MQITQMKAPVLVSWPCPREGLQSSDSDFINVAHAHSYDCMRLSLDALKLAEMVFHMHAETDRQPQTTNKRHCQTAPMN